MTRPLDQITYLVVLNRLRFPEGKKPISGCFLLMVRKGPPPPKFGVWMFWICWGQNKEASQQLSE